MTAAILEIRDGVATGPLHQPVPQIGRNTRFDDEAFDWPTLCGVRGHAYQRDALAALGHSSECFECAVEAMRRPTVKKAQPFTRDRQTYKRDWMREKRGTVQRSPRACVFCGSVFTPSVYGPRNARRFCSSSCRKKAWRRAA